MQMSKEDGLSRQREEYTHRMHFLEKDLPLPMLPESVESGEFFNFPKPKSLPAPGAPQQDNFVKYAFPAKLLPPKLSLDVDCKVVWSRQKQNE